MDVKLQEKDGGWKMEGRKSGLAFVVQKGVSKMMRYVHVKYMLQIEGSCDEIAKQRR
jgi:hypothetical protein